MGKANIENGMYVISKKQKELLKELLDVVERIENNCKTDEVFDQFIKDLSVFEQNELKDLTEIISILIDNTYGPFM